MKEAIEALTTNAKIKEEIEERWRTRVAQQGLKYGTKAYLKAECEFFVGAMTALNAAFPDTDPSRLSRTVPPIWVVNIMAGKSII